MEIDGQKKQLINLFYSIYELEKKILLQRKKLQQNYCFDSPFGYFKFLDKTKKNYLDYNDIINFIKLGKIQYKPNQIKQIIKTYDKDNDHCWNFDEYSLFISSNNNLSQQNTNIYNDNSLKNYEISDAIELYERELIELFKLEIQFIEFTAIKIKGIKEIKSNNKEIFNIENIFNKIKGKSQVIDINCIFYFINDGYHNINIDDCKFIINKIGNGIIITLKNLDNLFKYDKYIQEKDTTYFHSIGYYKTNPIDNTQNLYYNSYLNNKNSQNEGV